MNLTAVKEDQPISDVFQLRVSAFAQWVFNGEVVHILLQWVIQRAHLAIFPQSIQHQGGKDLGYTGNPTEGVTMEQIQNFFIFKRAQSKILLFMKIIRLWKNHNSFCILHSKSWKEIELLIMKMQWNC